MPFQASVQLEGKQDLRHGGGGHLASTYHLVNRGGARTERREDCRGGRANRLLRCLFNGLRGDVMCAEFDQIAYHGYCRADMTAIAWFRVAYPDEAVCEIISLFDSGAMLLTTSNSNIRDNPGKGVYVRESLHVPAADILAAHEQRLTTLKEKLGAPRELPTRVSGFAEILAGYLEKPDRKSTRLNSSHVSESRMPSSA